MRHSIAVAEMCGAQALHRGCAAALNLLSISIEDCALDLLYKREETPLYGFSEADAEMVSILAMLESEVVQVSTPRFRACSTCFNTFSRLLRDAQSRTAHLKSFLITKVLFLQVPNFT
jgi:hypothetical protein